jgi:uncharacterized protein (DUF427 family)
MTETLSRPLVPSAMERARLKEGVHIERSPRRIRTYFGGKLIADSDRVLLVYETKRPPAYWFPIPDVRMEHLEKKDELRQGTDTTRWRVAVSDRVAQNAARAYIKPVGDRAALEGHLTFFWDQMMPGSKRMKKSSFILATRTLGSTRSTARGTCAR